MNGDQCYKIKLIIELIQTAYGQECEMYYTTNCKQDIPWYDNFNKDLSQLFDSQIHVLLIH